MKTLVRMTCGCLLLLIECGFCLGQNTAGPIKITLCELCQHPEDYAGKIIKVRGGSVSGLGIQDLMHDSQPVPCPTLSLELPALESRQPKQARCE
jgi:hypothetical protein